MKAVWIGVVAVGWLALAGCVASLAIANHPVSEAKATVTFKRYIERNFGGEFVSGPTCTRTSPYSLHCEGVADFPDGSTRCAEGDVVGNGPQHHTVRVVEESVRECTEYDLPAPRRQLNRIERFEPIEHLEQR
jgi:hypothetical protein